MARTTIATSTPPRRSDDKANQGLPPAKRRMAIVAGAVLVISLSVVGWYIFSSPPEYQEVPAAPPPENTLLTIVNTTNNGATVKVSVVGEATPPTGFVSEGAPVKNPMQAELEPQQYGRFEFSDTTMLMSDAPAEIEIEANVGGTSIKGTFTISRKKRVVINIYDAAGPVTFDVGPGVMAK